MFLSTWHASTSIIIKGSYAQFFLFENHPDGSGLNRVQKSMITMFDGEPEQSRVRGELVPKLGFANTFYHGHKVPATASKLNSRV